MRANFVSAVVLSLVAASFAADLDEVCGPTDQAAYRPCPTLNLPCIRNYVQVRSPCQAFAPGPSDSFIMEPVELSTAQFNLTAMQYSNSVGGMSRGEIVEFTINPEKDMIVLTIKYTGLVMTNRYEFAYHQPGKEPREFDGVSDERFNVVNITSIVKGINNPQWDSAIHVHSLDSIEYTLDGECFNVEDEVLGPLLEEFTANIDVVIQETFLARNEQLQRYYIDNNLCNLKKN
ncbi:hypothetical protein JYU34_010171 [Plutella xylostella]|uniref:Uncharacterized protein n=2 Tax=Plutella xylostella TaxID=51655 RepID=A0ABQ7QIC8_PLUXY|nr:hypothetical protein JYU34_010171 [Plutella xylostella]CAG9128892.1 unnamed protein product [Plutella xylostella]